MNAALDILESIAFGRFRIVPRRRELLAGDEPVRLGGRAFDLLMVLIETPGAVVSKDELLARVWPDRVVAETSLQAQILALRRAFGVERGLIRTVAGRGYEFTGDIQIIRPNPDRPISEGLPVAADAAVATLTNLPQPVSELIGRDGEVEEVSNLVRAGRLVTLTGTGGIGKTRLALAIARRLLSQFSDGAWLAEFSPLSDPNLVPAALAAAMGLEIGGELSAQRVAQALRTRRLLVVLDTCEHVIDAAAAMAEALLQAGSATHIIATSREPLRAAGERLYRVPPLAVPAEGAEDIQDYGAVRLFVQRARAAQPGSVLGEHRAPTIAAICRRLDGIPLAIEMAAARVAALDIEELAGRLDERLRLLTGGKRTALPRHQTLRATLDWSHELLAGPERVILRRLAVFAGAFTLEAAGAVAASDGVPLLKVVDGISGLVAKSLVVAEVDAPLPRYRLLDTTRSYALEKLAKSGERERLARRHAEYFRDLFEQSEVELEKRSTADWLGDYGRQIDNLRAALAWAFSSGGDAAIGAALSAAAVPLWMHFSLLEECRGQVERTLAVMAAGGGGDARLDMKLNAALGVSLLYASDATLVAIGATWTRVLEIAKRLDDAEYQLRALWGRWVFEWGSGRQRAALILAREFHHLAASRPDPNDRLVGDRLIGISQQLLGDLPSARRHLEHAHAHYVPPIHRSYIIRFQNDQRGAAGSFLGKILWLQGFPDQAIRVVERSVEDASASRHVVSSCHVLIHGACPVALWVGDLAIADRYIQMLIGLATRHSLPLLHSMGLSFQGLLAIKRGDVAAGLPLLRSGLKLGEVYASFRYFIFLSDMAEALVRVGQIGEALTTLEVAIAGADEAEELWGKAELLRLKGELLLLQGAPGATTTAKDHFEQALAWARRQGALSWELRAATSFARLLRDQGRPADAAAVLQPVYDRFIEGFDTVDLKTAKAVLQDLH
jgi:predicted ATPase/DNA-binding winged helix-turn-helix (wHTH) protein